MSEAAVPTTPKDGLITFGVIYVLLAAVGNLSTHMWMWMSEPARPESLALFAVLVALYAFCTGPGRRTGWRAYLLCGALLPGVLWLVAIIGYALPLSYDAYTVYEVLTAGLGVGFRVSGGGNPPFAVTLILWALGIVLAVIAAPIFRKLGRKTAAN